MLIIILTLWFSIHPTYPSIAHASEALLLAWRCLSRPWNVERSASFYASCRGFCQTQHGICIWSVAHRHLDTLGHRGERRDASGCCREIVVPTGITTVAYRGRLSVFMDRRADTHRLPSGRRDRIQVLNYGFFTGAGRLFWAPAHNLWSLTHGPAGLWIAATIFLACSAFGTASRLWARANDSDGATQIRDEIILTCFVLHAAFVCLFFGNQWSWFYYSYFLIIGVAAAVDTGPIARRAGIAICLISAFSGFGVSDSVLHLWKTREPTPVTAWMWSQPAQATEWSEVLNLTRGHRTTILDTKGAAELMFPQFQPPVSLYLDPGLMLSADINRKVQQLADSDLVVVPLGIATCGGIPDSPKIHAAMNSFEPIFSGHYFVVYRRTEQSTRR